MPFRNLDGDPGFAVPADPLARFDELLTALDAGRGWMQDKVAIRLAAINLLVTPGDAKRLAASTRTGSAILGERLRGFSRVDESVRLVIAAQLVKADVHPEEFLDDLERVRQMFRADGLRRGGVYEVLAVLVLRRLFGRIEQEHVERLHGIYEAMKAHHWWLTGPEDFPACAMLVGRPEEPAAIGAGTDAIYKALHEQAGLSRGDPLQTAANILYLGGVEAPVIVERFSSLLAAFRAAGAKIGTSEYDEVAILKLRRPAGREHRRHGPRARGRPARPPQVAERARRPQPRRQPGLRPPRRRLQRARRAGRRQAAPRHADDRHRPPGRLDRDDDRDDHLSTTHPWIHLVGRRPRQALGRAGSGRLGAFGDGPVLSGAGDRRLRRSPRRPVVAS
ncbi:DUF4003 family protein [Nannocystis pusilla]|uniref:DUF4003 family protein n=1 Tax=Nannocystis pusilla TaxID=889268 RepID=UPI003DA2DCAD